MNDRNICEIVEDILPLFIDNSTSETTAVFIEKHLQECTKCREVFRLMNHPLSNAPVNNKKIRYKKKFYSILALGIISMLIILAFVVVVISTVIKFR